ncbi:MAG TPA: Na/Pi symporter [Cytophagales bacterium]|nr:Na/Pi symporter [Cytophagales bacterium]
MIRNPSHNHTIIFLISLLLFFLLSPEIAFAWDILPQSDSSYDVNTFKIVINFLAGLILFLYGITLLSKGIKYLAKERVKGIISKFTTNRFAGVGSGLFATTIFDSSSVAIIMAIAFVNAGVLTSSQSLGVVLGANLGTTISSQIIAFDLYEYAPIAMFLGFLLFSLNSKKKIKKIGVVIFSIGMIFFGLKEMGEAMSPLQNNPSFLLWMKSVENPLIGVVVGAAFTVVIQSSSATLGIIITLASQGMISLPAGIALMMGAEIGTCADTLVATIGRTRDAVKVGVFHLLFNVICVILGLIFFSSFTSLVTLTSLQGGLGHQIANAHLLFNLIGVLLFIGFTPWISSFLDRIIPESKYSQSEVIKMKGNKKSLFNKLKE